MARASLLVAFSLVALAAGADESCSSGAEEAALLQTGNSQGRSITAHGARAGSSCAPPLPGKNNGGSNMGSSPGSGYGGDASSCEQLCGSTGGCQGWTFMQSIQTSTKQCWLKDANLYCPAQDSTDPYNTYTSGFCNGACSSPGPTPSPPSPGPECASPLPGKNNGCEPVLPCPGQHRPVQHVHLRLLQRRVLEPRPHPEPPESGVRVRLAASRRPPSSAGSRMRTCTALPRTTPTSTTRTPPASAAARAGEHRVVVCDGHAEGCEPSAVGLLCAIRLLSTSRRLLQVLPLIPVAT
ncbi:unnamed protein product [Prorocentrum cordatum]|uniref:Apple domain-containing protein n=1 Tax=Prorocentrum cordatum TaxID=2364126 RepID=A0ABN9RK52_9DINO|nr:unnamed protein product [Polarella glacialis]